MRCSKSHSLVFLPPKVQNLRPCRNLHTDVYGNFIPNRQTREPPRRPSVGDVLGDKPVRLDNETSLHAEQKRAMRPGEPWGSLNCPFPNERSPSQDAAYWRAPHPRHSGKVRGRWARGGWEGRAEVVGPSGQRTARCATGGLAACHDAFAHVRTRTAAGVSPDVSYGLGATPGCQDRSTRCNARSLQWGWGSRGTLPMSGAGGGWDTPAPLSPTALNLQLLQQPSSTRELETLPHRVITDVP